VGKNEAPLDVVGSSREDLGGIVVATIWIAIVGFFRETRGFLSRGPTTRQVCAVAAMNHCFSEFASIQNDK
jgi:hypothetical protein